jgi:uncharacterized RDD family membrane protein YckC
MRAAKANCQELRTPEGITFSLQLAGPLRRFLAWLLDCVVIALLSVGLVLLCAVLGTFAVLSPLGAVDVMLAVFTVGTFAITFGYNILFEFLWHGQTLGKRLLRLRVVDEFGLRLRFSQIAIRNLLRVVDQLPLFYAIGAAAMFFSPRSQRLGDLAASTLVVYLPVLRQPDLQELFADKYNSFRDHPHLVARLRQVVTPREAQLALESLLRREEFEPASRTTLFQGFADHFRAKLRFPEAACVGLSDEKYVRNVVDVVLTQQQPGNPA